MFKATVENLDSSMSPRSTSIVESRKCSSGFSASTGLGVAADGVSKSPKGVTKDVEVDSDRSVEFLVVGLGVRERVSSVMSDSSSSASGSSLPEVVSNDERKGCQRRFARI
jgi:hypothetical protein